MAFIDLFKEGPGDAKGAGGKLSLSRFVALAGVLVGGLLVVWGCIAVFGNPSLDEKIAKVYKDIIVAGLGVFAAGGITKAVNRIGEGLRGR